MDFSEKRTEWDRLLIQAAQFAEVDNTVDAVERARFVLNDVDRALASATSTDGQTELRGYRSKVEQRLSHLNAAHDEWVESVKARHAAYEADEERAYEAPLPVPGLSPNGGSGS